MTIALLLAALAACILGSALYSGAETASYTLSHRRVRIEEQRGHRRAGLLWRLVQDDTSLLMTILIGNNLMHELCTHVSADVLVHLDFPAGGREIATTILLTPVLFFFAEVLPKDLFRRRPHDLGGRVAPFLNLSRLVFWPLVALLRGASALLARGAGLEARAVTGYHGREQVLEFLEEGRLAGVLPAHAGVLAHNALRLRTIPVETVMSPWSEAVCLHAQSPEPERLAEVAASPRTRLPIVDGEGRVDGYVHQLEVLTGSVEGARPPARDGVLQTLDHRRPLIALEPGTPVDRALLRLRAGGQRLALVGTPELSTLR